MKVSFAISIISTFAATAIAASCDASNALDVTPYLEELSKGNGGGGGGGASLTDYDQLYRIAIDNAVKRRVKRATLDCKTSETCVAIQGAPFCFDAVAYTWRDTAGDYGNLKDGSYTLSDGRKGNLFNGPYPLPEDASNTSPPASTPTSNSNGDSSAKTGMPDATTTGGSTTGAPSASQTPSGGVKIGGNMAMGLAIAAIGGALAILL